jgi:hypothetical protein
MAKHSKTQPDIGVAIHWTGARPYCHTDYIRQQRGIGSTTLEQGHSDLDSGFGNIGLKKT